MMRVQVVFNAKNPAVVAEWSFDTGTNSSSDQVSTDPGSISAWGMHLSLLNIPPSSLAKVQFPFIFLFPLWGLFNQSLLNIGPIAYKNNPAFFIQISWLSNYSSLG